jgi:hypothetical protein
MAKQPRTTTTTAPHVTAIGTATTALLAAVQSKLDGMAADLRTFAEVVAASATTAREAHGGEIPPATARTFADQICGAWNAHRTAAYAAIPAATTGDDLDRAKERVKKSLQRLAKVTVNPAAASLGFSLQWSDKAGRVVLASPAAQLPKALRLSPVTAKGKGKGQSPDAAAMQPAGQRADAVAVALETATDEHIWQAAMQRFGVDGILARAATARRDSRAARREASARRA